MAFLSRVGNLLKQSGSKHVNMGLSSSNSPLFQAIRSMSSAKLFVGGLAYATDEMGLREAFQQYGEVIEARVITDRDSGRSRGFGFVSFTSADAANTALQDMDGKELHGRRIRVNFAQERPRPSFGGGGYGGAGGGGGYGGTGGYGGGGYGGTGGYGGGSYGSSGGYGDGGSSSNIGGYGGGNYNAANADDGFSGGLGGGSGISSVGQSGSFGAPPGGSEDVVDGDLDQDLAENKSRADNEEDDYANTSNK